MSDFEALPVEMLSLIFSHLELPEIAKCRLISKKFKFSADQVRVNQLAVIVDRYQYLSSLPFKYDACEPILEPNLLCLLNPEPFSSSLASVAILKNLEYLNISGYVNWQLFDITALNVLDKLKQIDFNCSVVIDGTRRLAPVNLQVLSFGEPISRRNRDSDDHILIEAPRLRVVACQRLDGCIQFSHPETIEKLELNTCSQNLSKFVNLKIFQQNFGSRIRKDMLLSLSSQLRELHIYLGEHINKLYVFLKETIAELLHQRAALERSQLRIFLMGIEVIESRRRDVDDFDEQFLCYYGLKSFFPVSQSYKHLANTLPFYQTFDCSVLDSINFGYERIPGDFFMKFTNIREVVAYSCQLNQGEFTSFLSRIRYLIKLSIVHSTMLFDRRFFERLPLICPLLSNLVLYENCRRDFSFILQFKMLIQFETNKFHWLRHAPDAYLACRYLSSFKVCCQSKPRVTIRRILNRSPGNSAVEHGYLVSNTAMVSEYRSPLKLDDLTEICERLCGDLDN